MMHECLISLWTYERDDLSVVGSDALILER